MGFDEGMQGENSSYSEVLGGGGEKVAQLPW